MAVIEERAWRTSGGIRWGTWAQMRDGHPAAVQTGPIDPIRTSNPQACFRSARPAAIIPVTVGVHKPTCIVTFLIASC